ncbi:MAG: hypothetical protein ACK4JE_03340 [Endomicrobiia bacterium]
MKKLLFYLILAFVLISTPFNTFSKADEEMEVLNEIKQEEPGYYKDLMGLKENKPEIYRKLISDEIKKRKFLNELKKRNPQLWKNIIKANELEKKTKELAGLYKTATNFERKAELKSELRNLLSELFDLRQENYKTEINELENRIAHLKSEEKHKTEIEELETRLKELKSKIEERKQNKKKIVERQLENLIAGEESKNF